MALSSVFNIRVDEQPTSRVRFGVDEFHHNLKPVETTSSPIIVTSRRFYPSILTTCIKIEYQGVA